MPGGTGRRAPSAAGVDWLRPFHDYRHFFCHYLVNEGKADYVVVAKLAGHKNPSMTLRYSEPGLEVKRAAMQIFEKTGDSGFLATSGLDNTGSGANLPCKPLPKPLESRLPIHDKLFSNN
ncbi:MAG: site-specific integrase [Nitrospinae bacterium]|nr:site-specific integrase [Nitrospinota bacterium]